MTVSKSWPIEIKNFDFFHAKIITVGKFVFMQHVKSYWIKTYWIDPIVNQVNIVQLDAQSWPGAPLEDVPPALCFFAQRSPPMNKEAMHPLIQSDLQAQRV